MVVWWMWGCARARSAETDSSSKKLTITQTEARARQIIDKMFGDASLNVMSSLSWFFRKVVHSLSPPLLLLLCARSAGAYGCRLDVM